MDDILTFAIIYLVGAMTCMINTVALMRGAKDWTVLVHLVAAIVWPFTFLVCFLGIGLGIGRLINSARKK